MKKLQHLSLEEFAQGLPALKDEARALWGDYKMRVIFQDGSERDVPRAEWLTFDPKLSYTNSYKIPGWQDKLLGMLFEAEPVKYLKKQRKEKKKYDMQQLPD